MNKTHDIRRVRHETVRRDLTVLRTQLLSPQYLRITLGGPQLAGFLSLGFDDHVKLFLPDPANPAGEPAKRDYTPQRYDAERQELDIDFVLHGEGPAATWAAQVEPGQTLHLGGPRGSMVIPTDFDAHVLVGDASAWPAISRRLAELPAGSRAFVVVDLGDVAETLPFASRAQIGIQWLRGDATTPGTRLATAVTELSLPPGDIHYWAAGETQAIREVRTAFVTKGAPKEWIKAAGYWRHGAVGAHEPLDA